ncbi:MAG: hypothetical protein ACTSVI_08000 [Promethearchaeota archaeon]
MQSLKEDGEREDGDIRYRYAGVLIRRCSTIDAIDPFLSGVFL